MPLPFVFDDESLADSFLTAQVSLRSSGGISRFNSLQCHSNVTTLTIDGEDFSMTVKDGDAQVVASAAESVDIFMTTFYEPMVVCTVAAEV
jgi:hypothetical protein